LATIPDSPIHNIGDLIQFNLDHAAEEMPPSICSRDITVPVSSFANSTLDANTQDNFFAIEKFNISRSEYEEIFQFGRRKSREGIDKAMKEQHNVNVLVGPSECGLFLLAAMGGKFIYVYTKPRGDTL
jgi:hypothetical protein